MKRAIGKLERQFQERHSLDLKLSKSKDGHPRGLTFDAAAGKQAVAQARVRRHGQVGGQRQARAFQTSGSTPG